MNQFKPTKSSVGFAIFLALTLNCSKTTTTTGLSKVSENLTAVASGYNPSSLTYSSSSTSLQDGGPCGNLSLFACQPVLLRVYIAISKQMFEMTQTIVSGVQSHFDALADGSSGTGMEVASGTTIDYNKTSASKFKVLIKQSGTPAMYLDVDSDTYVLTADIGAMSGGESSGAIKNTISFTDSTHWTANIQIAGQACNSNDTRAPRGIQVTLERSADIWNVLAQLYFPSWLEGLTSGGSPTCATTATSSNSIVMYTQAVGDNTAAKAGVYIMKTNVALASLSSYPLSSLCENYFSGISGVSCSSGGLVTSSYPNTYCNKTENLTAEWNNSCASYSTAVSSATLPSNFTEPSVLAATTFTVPSSIE